MRGEGQAHGAKEAKLAAAALGAGASSLSQRLDCLSFSAISFKF
jgi:hypothetical protein